MNISYSGENIRPESVTILVEIESIAISARNALNTGRNRLYEKFCQIHDEYWQKSTYRLPESARICKIKHDALFWQLLAEFIRFWIFLADSGNVWQILAESGIRHQLVPQRIKQYSNQKIISKSGDGSG